MNDHNMTDHSKIRSQNPNNSKSVFMKPGRIINPEKEDPYYDYKNMELVKTTSKKFQIIGGGAFGDVYLAKHKKDGKLFAIKKVNI